MAGGAGFMSDMNSTVKKNRRLLKKDRSFGKKKFTVSAPKSNNTQEVDEAFLKTFRHNLKKEKRRADIKKIILLAVIVALVVIAARFLFF